MTTATIESRTNPGIAYIVTLHDNGAASCTCKAAEYGRSCHHVVTAKAEAADATERRNAAALAIVNAQIDVMTRQIERHGHLMPNEMFRTLQKRYWTARKRRAELTGIPLVSVA